MNTNLPLAAPSDSLDSAACITNYLSARREGLLEAWAAAVDADPELTSSNALSRTQFRDHIPEVLAEFEDRLLEKGHPGLSPRGANRCDASVAHGGHRWQQGYDLREVILEWGHLQHCLLDELEGARVALPDLSLEVFLSAQRSVVALIHLAIADSAEQFARLQQKESIRERGDLESAVARFVESDSRRSKRWRESAHDLRGQLSLLASSTSLLEEPDLEEALRSEALEMLQKGTRVLKGMLASALEDLQSDNLREECRLEGFEVGTLLGGLCAASQPLARERGLSLRSNGPQVLEVEGDRGKVQRIAQNLLLNALSYTGQGSVTLSWQTDGPGWWSFQVRDTGPGLPDKDSVSLERGSGRPLDGGLGLPIVRRLTELLGARLHTETAPGVGTTFTVTLPRFYPG